MKPNPLQRGHTDPNENVSLPSRLLENLVASDASRTLKMGLGGPHRSGKMGPTLQNVGFDDFCQLLLCQI